MADIRTLDSGTSLLNLRSEILFTKLRLEADERTNAHAAAFAGMLERFGPLSAGQLLKWDGEDAADVAVAVADDRLDDAVDQVEVRVRVSIDKNHPQYARFFAGQTVKAIQRMGLESEIGRVEGWPASLAEMGPLASEAGTTLAAAIAAGRAALASRVSAAAARADHRASEIERFVDDLNALRRSTLGALMTSAAADGLSPSWPYRFFRKSRVTRGKTE